MAQITYTNKVALNENPEIADINKVTDDDMNEIKQVVNDNYNNTIQITDTEPTDNDWKLWIDSDEVGSQASEITNEYSTSTGLGYSANYINNLNTYSTTEQRIGTWIDGKPLYRKVVEDTLPTASTTKDVDIANNIDIALVKGGYNISIYNLIFPIPFISNDTIISAYITNSRKLRLSNNNANYNNNVVKVIVEYTKTTD